MVDEVARVEAEQAAEKPYDTSDPQQVNTARKKSARLRRERLEVVRALMDLPAGRLWIYDQLEECHIFSPSFVPGDQYQTAFKEGERNVGLRLLGDVMAASPDKYVDMCKEGKARK